ncbi:MAG: alpha-amylase family glycosyl hydrolase [Butyrivibrio sp.]|nr:alpha-amylase family glycosyl hydrolase [Butyrivibrio sp.]
MRKKRLISVICILMLIISMISGCGGNGATYKYDYEQELNVIDDNYRNYYEIFVYSFYDSDGDGIGDLKGVIEKLDYVADMGFNGIWLMPIMPSPTYHKYDVTDYYNIDEAYGTLDDFKALVDECHARGIRLVIDLVMNHSSSQHEWFKEACAYLSGLEENEEPDLSVCPYVDYYHFSKEQVSGSWYNVNGTSWYYEGEFWSEMPDLNFACDKLKKEFEDIAKFWIELGVDGFRMDAAMHFEEGDTDFNTQTLNWLFTYCQSLNPDFYMVSEVWTGEPAIASYYASMTPSMFNFDAANAEGKIIGAAKGTTKAASFVQAMLKYQEDFSAVNPDYIDAPFITNHDMGRVANALQSNEDDLKMACGLLMTMSGSPFVYYGEEIGMKSKGRKDENKRLPMIWSDTDTTGITDGPKDADSDITMSFPGVEQQLEDEASLLNYYKRAVRIRSENPEIARGKIEIVDSLTDGYLAFITKTWEGSVIGIAYNNSDEEMTLSLSGSGYENMAIRGYMTLHGEVVTLKNETLTLPACSICVLK